MPIHILRGLPGSGKSTRFVETVNSAIAQKWPVLTFACIEAPELAERKALRVNRVLGCRRPGLVCPLHHFVPTAEAAEILSRAPAGSLAAFEESQYFGPELVPHWIEASRRGVEVLISMPSEPQLTLLKDEPHTETVFQVTCQRCNQENAFTFVVVPETGLTMALCPKCHAEMADAARREILERLERQPPHPGEKAIYQPVDELPECADWKVVRPDSKARAEVMSKIMQELGLPGLLAPKPATYLDIGCNTGYFCHRMRQLGFFAEGVDVVKGDIAVAKLLDSFFRRDFNRYIAQDAYAYLRDTQDNSFDVTSAFAVFQWLMIQTTVERGITCLEWLFAKTKQVCFLEMGYSAEPQYKERLKANIDREWVRRIMEEKGGFSEVRLFDAKEQGLMFGRDLFVGIKNTKAAEA